VCNSLSPPRRAKRKQRHTIIFVWFVSTRTRERWFSTYEHDGCSADSKGFLIVVLYGKQFESIPDDMLCKFLNLCAGGITQTERTRCELLTKCCSPTALDLFIFRLKVVCFGLRITPLLMILLNEVKLKFKTQIFGN